MRSSLLVALLALAALPARAQDPSLDPAFGSVELKEGFEPDPVTVELVAGGDVEPAVDGCGYGLVAEAPDFDLYYETSGESPLFVYVVSGGDATLLVNLPDGSWMCDDDNYGNGDPILVLPAQSGLYDIWVGTYGGESTEATLFISEVLPDHLR